MKPTKRKPALISSRSLVLAAGISIALMTVTAFELFVRNAELKRETDRNFPQVPDQVPFDYSTATKAGAQNFDPAAGNSAPAAESSQQAPAADISKSAPDAETSESAPPAAPAQSAPAQTGEDTPPQKTPAEQQSSGGNSVPAKQQIAQKKDKKKPKGKEPPGKHPNGASYPPPEHAPLHPPAPELPWPRYQIKYDAEGKSWPWPGVQWMKGSLDDPAFKDKVKFYMYDDGPFDMKPAEECMRKNKELPPSTDPGRMEKIDHCLRVNEREYLTELWMLPAMRIHPMRTMNKDEAKLFIIGYANPLARMATPCWNAQYGNSEAEWDDKVTEALENDPYWKRNQGRDFLYFHTRYKVDMTRRLRALLDSGPIVTPFDRYSGRLHGSFLKAWERGSVLVMPYVSSVALDLHYQKPVKDPARTYFFRGNMHRWNGEREQLPNLSKLITNADFKEVSFVASGKPKNFVPILEESANNIRASNMCPSPEGDTPTALRLFETLVAGCVPVVIGLREQMTFTLPFPTLIDYDKISLFTNPIKQMVTHPNGLQDLADLLESFAGPNATEEKKAELEVMRNYGMEVYDKHFSFFRNPQGVASSILYEAWILLQKSKVIEGPYV